METNTLNETTPNQAPEQNSVKIYKKRVGRNGSGWKKNKTKYIADANLRRAKEISKVNTLSKNVKESGVLTKMPLCFFSYTTHDRKITAECSVKGLEAFINDPVVIEKFKKAVLAIQIDEDNLSVEEEDCEKEGVDFFDFPLSFPSQNAIKKRKLVNDLVKFDSGCSSKRMKWSDDIKPSWWPLDVDFISPDTKDNRPTVQTLDKILHAFHDDQVENKMDLMSEEDMPNASTIESLTDWSKLQLKTWRILMDWLRNRWQEPVLCLATQKISLRNRSIVADKGFSGREPVFHPDLAKCLSWLMFGTVDREELVIRIAIIASVYCLKNFSERMTQGNSDHSASHYKRLFKSDSMASLQQKLVDDSLAHKLDIFQVCAVGYFIGLSVNLCLDGEVVSHFTSNSQGINILIQGDEIFALSLTQDTLPMDCNRHNPFCCSESDGDETFSCPNCLLDYHSVCADRFSDCGCLQEGKELKYRVRTAIKEKALQLTWKKFLPDVKKLIKEKLDYRRLKDRVFAKLPDHCKNMVIRNLLQLKKDDERVRELIKDGQEELVLPEIILLLVKKTLFKAYKIDVSKLMLQRVLFK